MSYREQPSNKELLRMLSAVEKEKTACAKRVSLLEEELAKNEISVPSQNRDREKRHVLYLDDSDKEINDARKNPFPWVLMLFYILLAAGILFGMHWLLSIPVPR